jgi:hypothetical protein
MGRYLIRMPVAEPAVFCGTVVVFQINQLDATVSQIYHLTFMYSSACFGRPYAYHQELNNCRSSLWFYRWSVVVAVLLDQQHCYHHAPTIKPEAASAVVELLMMGVRTPETCWAVHKREVRNLRDCCIWLVDLFELFDDARTCKL